MTAVKHPGQDIDHAEDRLSHPAHAFRIEQCSEREAKPEAER